MKGGRRTTKGRIINMDDLIASAPHTTAVGNMGVNAQGDQLAPGGEVSQTREKRTRSYYKNHPQSSNQKVSLKGEMQDAFAQGHSDLGSLKPATSRTQAENVRTSVSKTSTTPAQDTMPDPELSEFNDLELPDSTEIHETPELDDQGDYVTEPAGYEEVELENGDIIMKPYWLSDTQDDQESDQDENDAQ